MALLNGHDDSNGSNIAPTQHLGKRKRTMSSDSEPNLRNGIAHPQQDLEKAFGLVKQHDPTTSIIGFPLPVRAHDGHTTKRLRSSTGPDDIENIRYRMSNGIYRTISDLIDDIKQIEAQVTMQSSTINGESVSDSTMSKQLDIILNSLHNIDTSTKNLQSSPPPITNGDTLKIRESPSRPSSQVLSLRSQTEHGIRQLFSGLPSGADAAKSGGPKLPNGFEFAEVLNVSQNDFHGKERRNFGEVFAAPRNTKTLEMPRASRASRDNTLHFIKPYENIPNSTKNDYKFTNLTTGLWLRYDVSEKSKSDSKDVSQEPGTKNSLIFKAAFSTFAPCIDNSQSAITVSERSQQWLKRNITPPLTKAFSLKSDEMESAPQVDNTSPLSDQDFEEMLANYISDDEETSEIDDVFDEIAELIDTLSSYQSMRSLEIARGPSSASKPSKDEQATYELLRTQLQLLISTLPPYAVAKLNGDQLEELNISTHILVEPPDFVGTAQVDEYTMRRARAAQVATTAAVRNPAPMIHRPSYGTPASAYNAQARAYNNAPATAYVPRPPNVMYNTPRPATTAQVAYPPSQYRPAGPSIHTPSVQQFQRPTVNGYGSPAVSTSHTPYVQRPSQPGYQQRAQDSVPYARPEVSGKLLTNGDSTPQYQPRHYAPVGHVVPNNVTTVAGQSYEAMKQRQTSGTPQPRTEVAEGIATS